jgi:hypothetical protein
MKLPKFVTDLYTGPDGVTWAIGRVYSLPMLLAGLALPFVMAFRGQAVDLLAALGGYGALGGGVWALISGTNNTEPVAQAPDSTITTTATVSKDVI